MVPVSGVPFSAASFPSKIPGGEARVGRTERGATDATALESVDQLVALQRALVHLVERRAPSCHLYHTCYHQRRLQSHSHAHRRYRYERV